MTEDRQEKKWSLEDVRVLISFYVDKGPKYCAELLGRNPKSVNKKANRLGLYKKQNEKYLETNFKKIVEKSINYCDVCRNLGLSETMGNRQTIKKYIKKYNIDISHFKNGVPSRNNKKELNEILIQNSNYIHTTNLKDRLYKEGLKKRECELCGQGEEWKGKKMSLILDHKNGINNDNRLDNLRIVCPNCNATLETHGGKNIGKLKTNDLI